MSPVNEAVLILADGTLFEGDAFGAEKVGSGEIVFNTALSGYQEIATDPSYAGQIITFTYPHIGNYGTNADDYESRSAFCSGIVVRDYSPTFSNWRADRSLEEFLIQHNIAGISGIDTRRLTKHLRETGAIGAAFGTGDETAIKQAAMDAKTTDGVDLVASVTTETEYKVGSLDAPFQVIAYDFGIKRNILEHLIRVGCQVTVVPAGTPAEDVLSRKPNGVFLSNGPGDPAAVKGAAANVAKLLGNVPTFGICLGHQILGLATGAQTQKLRFGHHGANHPVRNENTGHVEITSQNHNYVVLADTVPGGAQITHVNLNDGTVEGMRLPEARAFSVQHHPEAAPGPHESAYLFDQFVGLMEKNG